MDAFDEFQDEEHKALQSAARDVLAHFYDHTHLARHPLLNKLRGYAELDRSVAVERLRRLFLELIERLRPDPKVPPDDPSWRPYTVLYDRYILGKSPPDIERDLNLGLRQLQREQRRGLAALALFLADKVEGPLETLSQAEQTLRQEIARVADVPQIFDLRVPFGEAIESIQALVARHDMVLRQACPEKQMLVLGSPALFKQLLVAALSFAVRISSRGVLAVGIDRQREEVAFCCHVPSVAASDRDREPPDALRILAKAQGATLDVSHSSDGWHLRIGMPAADKGYTIALVEDNRDLAALFSRYLSQRGYRLVELLDSTTAFEQLVDIKPDAIVLDIMMREVDGWELLQRIQADPRLSQVPVVVCSVLDEPDLAISLGANAFLRKPVRPAQLWECLTRLLRSPHNGEEDSRPGFADNGSTPRP